MIAELLGYVKAGAAIGAMAAVFGLLSMIVKTAPTWKKVGVDGDAELREDLMAEIRSVREEHRRNEAACRVEIGRLNGRVFLLGQSLILVTAEAEAVNPHSENVKMARLALRRAFPLDDVPEDPCMDQLLRDLDTAEATKKTA